MPYKIYPSKGYYSKAFGILTVMQLSSLADFRTFLSPPKEPIQLTVTPHSLYPQLGNH